MTLAIPKESKVRQSRPGSQGDSKHEKNLTSLDVTACWPGRWRKEATRKGMQPAHRRLEQCPVQSQHEMGASMLQSHGTELCHPEQVSVKGNSPANTFSSAL